MVVDEDDKSTAYGHVEFAGRGHKSGRKAENVAKEDKKTDCCDHGQVFLPLLSYDFNNKILKSLDDELEDALEFGGDKVESSRGETEKEDKGSHYNQAHDDVIREKMIWIFDFYPRETEKESKWFPDDFIEEVDYE